MVLFAIGNTVAKCAVTICNTGTAAVTNAFICISWWCYATENGNNCTVTAKYTSTDTNTATSTITAFILLWVLLLEIYYGTTICSAMFTITSSESIISTNKRYHMGKLLEK